MVFPSSAACRQQAGVMRHAGQGAIDLRGWIVSWSRTWRHKSTPKRSSLVISMTSGPAVWPCDLHCFYEGGNAGAVHVRHGAEFDDQSGGLAVLDLTEPLPEHGGTAEIDLADGADYHAVGDVVSFNLELFGLAHCSTATPVTVDRRQRDRDV